MNLPAHFGALLDTGLYPDSAGPYDADGMVPCNIVFVVALLAGGGGALRRLLIRENELYKEREGSIGKGEIERLGNYGGF